MTKTYKMLFLSKMNLKVFEKLEFFVQMFEKQFVKKIDQLFNSTIKIEILKTLIKS